MDKGKSPFGVGEEEGAAASNNSVVNSSSSASVSLATSELAHYDQTTSTDVMQLWHEISMMLESPQRNAAPPKAHSEALGGAVEDPSFDGSNGKNSEDFLSMLSDMDKSLSECLSSPKAMMGSETSVLMSPQSPFVGENLTSNPNEKLTVGKLGNLYLDGSSSSKSDPRASSAMFLSSTMARKRYSIAELAQIALLDPKRAKRVMANRTSAMKCKERKMRYTSELEQKAQTLQIETSRLSSQLDIAKEHNSALTLENKELMMRLQASEERAKLQIELTNALQAEMQGLQETDGQAIVDDGNSSNEQPSSSN